MRQDPDRGLSTPRAANEEGSGLERLTDPAEGSDPLTSEQLLVRRRRRHIRNAALGVVSVVAVLALMISFMSFDSDDDGTSVVAGENGDAPSPPATAPRVTVERTEVVGGDGGTARVVMEFDGPLPGGNVQYVEDITSLDAADRIVFTTQEPGGVHVCESIHNFPPPAVGTVDLLIPADWFADGDETHTSPLETTGNAAKFVVCGPHDGYYQYAIWGPLSAEADDVNVSIDSDRSRLSVQIDSEPDPTTTEPTAPAMDAPPVTAQATGDELQSAGIRFGPLPDGYVAWGEAERSVVFGDGLEESQEYRNLDQIRSVIVAIATGVPTERFLTDASGEPSRVPSRRSVHGFETYTFDLTSVSQQLQLSFADSTTTVFLSGYNTSWDELFDLADTFEVAVQR